MFHFLRFLIGKYWYVFILIVFAGSIFSFISVSNYVYHLDSPFLKAIGIHRKAKQIMVIKKALYWEFRAWQHRSVTKNFYSLAPKNRVYGSLESMTENGAIVFQYYEDDQIMRNRGRLANVVLVDKKMAARDLFRNRNKNVMFDVYRNNEIVVWMPDKIWNLSLIQKNCGIPDKNPPTNLVDRIFAEYYWVKLKNI